MVLPARIELATSALPRMRSTTELRQPAISRLQVGFDRPHPAGARYWRCRPGLSSTAPLRQGRLAMDEKPAKPTREERLAAKLRENLRRRKAQSREMGARQTQDAETAPLPKGPSKS